MQKGFSIFNIIGIVAAIIVAGFIIAGISAIVNHITPSQSKTNDNSLPSNNIATSSSQFYLEADFDYTMSDRGFESCFFGAGEYNFGAVNSVYDSTRNNIYVILDLANQQAKEESLKLGQQISDTHPEDIRPVCQDGKTELQNLLDGDSAKIRNIIETYFAGHRD